MEAMTIVYIVLAFLVGAALVFFFKKGGQSDKPETLEKLAELEQQNVQLSAQLKTASEESANKANQLAELEQQKSEQLAELEQQKSELTDKLDTVSKESTSMAAQLKEQYEALLAEATKQCESLDKQLQNVMDGHIDETIKAQLGEVDKLKKKIKDLEEEIEDQEDDIASLKKKIRTKDDDLVELQTNLSKEQSTSKQLQAELGDIQQQLDDKVKELQLKMGSLDFIQELLSAKEISTADVQKLYKNVDYFEAFVKGQYLDLNLSLLTSYDLRFNGVQGKAGFEQKKKVVIDAFEQWAATKRKSWLDGKTTIAFVGEFSAGKTSIVNRILSQDDPNIPLLPVSMKATTAIPTYIAGGSTVSYSFIAGDGKRKSILEDSFKKVSKEILDQVKGVSSLIKYFVMTYKNPNLDGLSILDTPGFNSNDQEDKERTIDVINECDALFWVFDVNAGTVNRSSISIIKEKLNKPLYVVINKVDTKSETEVQKVEDLIRKTLADEELKVEQFIRFSEKAPLEDMMKPIQGVSKIDARDNFLPHVREDLESLLKRFDDAVKEGNKLYDTAFKEGDNLTDQFCNSLKGMQRDCENAAGIPRWEEHIFSSDRYEMTAFEGTRLMSLLDKISDRRVKELAEKFDERVEKAQEIQHLWIQLSEVKSAWHQVEDCYKQFKKVTKDL